MSRAIADGSSAASNVVLSVPMHALFIGRQAQCSAAAGFHHSDLRLANVMEILQHNEASGAGSLLNGAIAEQKADSEKPAESDADSRCSSPRKSKYHFKVIDYGLANFEETYACGPDLYVDEVGAVTMHQWHK